MSDIALMPQSSVVNIGYNQSSAEGRRPVTICITAICDGGKSVISASDSMITNRALSIQFEHPLRKVTHLSEKCIALTAGDALAHTELFGMVQSGISQLKSPSIQDIVEQIKECYQNIRKSKIKERILKPMGFGSFQEFYEAHRTLIPEIAMSIQGRIDNFDYDLDIIVAGAINSNAHIYGINDPGTSQCFDAIGFHAIGSGLPHALNTLIAREHHQGTTLEESLLIVYEAKKMAEKAPGVGSNRTDLGILNSEGWFQVPDDKLSELGQIHSKWVIKESTWKTDAKSFLKELGVVK